MSKENKEKIKHIWFLFSFVLLKISQNSLKSLNFRNATTYTKKSFKLFLILKNFNLVLKV